MSYILQALRRSEETQRSPEPPPIPATVPDLAEEPRRVFVWAAVVLAVVGVAAAVAAGYYVYVGRGETATVAAPATPVVARKKAEPSPRAAAAPEVGPRAGDKPAAVAEAPPALTPGPFVEPARRSEVRDLAEQLRVPPPRRTAKAPPAAPPIAPVSPRETVIPGPAPVAPPPVARVDDGIKFLRAMPPDFQRELPALVVNIHIYSPNEAERILYINNRQYQAGDRVREDIRVEAIVEDGAVLSFRGQRFKLPRPS